MPLLKRFETELVPEWRKQCIDYKGLKRRAESLVGSEKAGDLQEREQEEFQQFFSHEMEKISHLYTKQERKLCKFFCAMEGKVDTMLAAIQANRKDFFDEDGSPNPGAIFQDAANKQVPVAMLAFLVHIDALRSFALLNTIAVLHISQRHCSKLIGSLVLHRLYQEPFYSCNRLTTLVEEITRISNKFLKGSIAPAAPHRAPSGDGKEPARRSSEGDAMEYLSAYCTWINHHGRVPPWVCRSLADSGSLQGDPRSIRVEPLMQTFVSELSAGLHKRGLQSMVPEIVKQMSVKPPQKQAARGPAATQPPAHQPSASRPVEIPQQAAGLKKQESPAGPHPVRAGGEERRSAGGMVAPVAQGKGVYTFATAKAGGGRVLGAGGQGPGVGGPGRESGQLRRTQGPGAGGGAGAGGAGKGSLRLTRSCWDLQALTLLGAEPAASLRAIGVWSETASSSGSSSIPSPTSSRSSSPPMGASPPEVAPQALRAQGQSGAGEGMRLGRMVGGGAEHGAAMLPHEGRNESVMGATGPRRPRDAGPGSCKSGLAGPLQHEGSHVPTLYPGTCK